MTRHAFTSFTLAVILGGAALAAAGCSGPGVAVAPSLTMDADGSYGILAAPRPSFSLIPATRKPEPGKAFSRPDTPRQPPRRTSPTGVGGSFSDEFNSVDGARWSPSDGWSNGIPFWCGWKSSQGTVHSGKLLLAIAPVASSGHPYSAGEWQTKQRHGYGRIEGRFQAAKGSGVVTSLFTYTGPAEGTPHDEIDMEILGRDTTRLQLNYYRNGVGGHETVVDLGFDAASALHSYAFEWSEKSIRWYVDGKLVHTETGTRGPLPVTPGRIIANVWPARGVNSWAGAFTYPGRALRAEYDRISYQAR